MNNVGPHSFRPLRLWDLRGGGRCRHCLLPMNAHPVHCYVVARPLGNKERAHVSWATLAGEKDRG